ncbi:carboxylating nicotinate-nucleotide diphosphorylase [Amphritea sp.]|uniref:carboxylating nicotinate-nucleotide diphosphorylase n=1 Tax=Amphritea sp. TaxID=1872502 RepID=UPI0025BCCD35|nr:carboxylating nicotinate-nucleotide diphosphorylase [Amphritea sp.]
MANTKLLTDIAATVKTALAEDIGDGDITAQLIPADQQAKARIISRQNAVICGVEWVNEVFRQVDKTVRVNWLVQDGEQVAADQTLFKLEGSARSLLTGERCALNFLQTLSATATISSYYASLVEGTGVKLLDTRKTIPGLRNAQKYAVSCSGCFNHRIGLYDAFLIKENHIMACGSITNAIATAKRNEPGKPVEVEVESFNELMQALEAGADIVMLDNFDHAGLRLAVQKNKEHPTPAKLEASGGIDEHTLRSIAETGVDYISIGLLTKDCKAVDLSMRFV